MRFPCCTRDGTIQALPPVVPGDQDSWEGIGINNDGTIVGTSRLSAPPAGCYELAGSSGFTFKDGVYRTFDYSNSIGTHPTAINDHGDIVGMRKDHNLLLSWTVPSRHFVLDAAPAKITPPFDPRFAH